MENKFVIFNVSELSLIDFTQVLETSSETVRKTVDQTLTFVNYVGEMPSSVQLLRTKSQEHTNDEILEILKSDAWSSPLVDFIRPA